MGQEDGNISFFFHCSICFLLSAKNSSKNDYYSVSMFSFVIFALEQGNSVR